MKGWGKGAWKSGEFGSLGNIGKLGLGFIRLREKGRVRKECGDFLIIEREGGRKGLGYF